MSRNDIPTLITELACDDVIRCQQARRSLVAMGHKAVPSLVAALGSGKNWVRWEAAKALSQIGDPAATRPLITALEDREFDVRWLAAEGLITIGKKIVEPLLQALINKPESIWLREGAHHVLHDMDRDDWDDALKPVMTALEGVEPTFEVPVTAKRTLDTLVDKPI
jgi:HEAT repeat protein